MELPANMKLIEALNRGRFPYCNVLLVKNVLVDAGAGIEIIKELRSKVEVLILSHTHPDHASGAWMFDRVLAPGNFKTDLDSLANRFAGEFAELWKKYITTSTGMRSFECERFEAGVIMEDPRIEAIPVLGHSADHHVFLIEDRILFGSDVDLTSFGPFYGNPESDPYLFRREIRKIYDLDFEIFVSAHLTPALKREEALNRLDTFLEKFDEREKKILDLLDEPKTLNELVRISPIYGKKPYAREMLDFFEGNMIRKHLDGLVKSGKVKKDGEYYFKA